MAALALALALAAVAPLSAQTSEGGPDPAQVRVRIGPLLMNPTMALTNLGIDDNVFNEPEDLLPKRDFTATLTPSTDLWVRMGRTWISGTVKEELIWYQKYATERAANSGYRRLLVAPGIDLRYEKWKFFASVSVPLAQYVDTDVPSSGNVGQLVASTLWNLQLGYDF